MVYRKIKTFDFSPAPFILLPQLITYFLRWCIGHFLKKRLQEAGLLLRGFRACCHLFYLLLLLFLSLLRWLWELFFYSCAN